MTATRSDDTKNDLADDLDSSKRHDDVKCEVRLEPDPRDDGGMLVVESMSVCLLERLLRLATANHLPLLARLSGGSEFLCSGAQAPSLEDELVFLLSVDSDPSLLEAVGPFQRIVARAVRDKRGQSIIVKRQ